MSVKICWKRVRAVTLSGRWCGTVAAWTTSVGLSRPLARDRLRQLAATVSWPSEPDHRASGGSGGCEPHRRRAAAAGPSRRGWSGPGPAALAAPEAVGKSSLAHELAAPGGGATDVSNRSERPDHRLPAERCGH